jgi:hypothetical protein
MNVDRARIALIFTKTNEVGDVKFHPRVRDSSLVRAKGQTLRLQNYFNKKGKINMFNIQWIHQPP